LPSVYLNPINLTVISVPSKRYRTLLANRVKAIKKIVDANDYISGFVIYQYEGRSRLVNIVKKPKKRLKLMSAIRIYCP
jgi:hypothetical protein